MCQIQKHRGPDDEGTYCRKPIALGHRRLSIVDLDFGHQPLSNEDDTMWLVYNGEIYNHLDLRRDLISRGHRFKTHHSDSEVILHAYEEYGEKCVGLFNGIFAFAIWDSKRKQVFLARDRFGIKPLYYFLSPQKLLFASEIKALFVEGTLSPQADPAAVIEYFTYQNLHGSTTLFKGVELLPAGSTMIVGDRSHTIHSFWDISYDHVNAKLSLTEAASILRGKLETAVQSQLMSDVPVGSFLSGGMDTGALAVLGHKFLPSLQTFTCGYDMDGITGDEVAFDERQDAQLLADQMKNRHIVKVLRPDTLQHCLSKLVWHLDEPRMGMSYPPYMISKVAARHVKAIFAGHGGDEFHAGYAARYRYLMSLGSEREFEDGFFNMLAWVVPPARQAEAFSSKFLHEVRDIDLRAPFDRVIEKSRGWNPLHRALYYDAKVYLHGLLVVEDKLGMAHSLECRVPLLENDFIDFTLTIPAEHKLSADDHKIALKHSLRDLLPSAILTKPKMGFGPPDHTWYRTALQHFIRKTLLSDRALSRGYFRPEFIRGLVWRHMDGVERSTYPIWSLLNFEIWSRLFIDGEGFAQAGCADSPRALVSEVMTPPIADKVEQPTKEAPSEISRPPAPEQQSHVLGRKGRRFPLKALKLFARHWGKGKRAVRLTTLMYCLLVVPYSWLRLFLKRMLGLRPSIVWGPTPILNISTNSELDRRLGYESDTIVYTTYFITEAFDYNLGPLVQDPELVNALPHFIFLWTSLRYDYFHFYYDWGFWSWANIVPGVRELELHLLKLAGKRVIISAYGADIRVKKWTEALGKYHCCMECEQVGKACHFCEEGDALKNLDLLKRHATVLLSMMEMTEYTPGSRNDINYWPIDVERMQYIGVKRHASPVKVVHAPNHRAYKGTRFLIQVVEEMKREGYPVELILVERKSNEEARRIYAEADVVAEQFIIGSIGYFGVEAMAMGKPVICYLRDRQRYMPGGDECPILSANPDKLKEVLVSLVTDGELRRRLGRRCRDYTEKYWSFEAVGKKFDRLYIDLWKYRPMMRTNVRA